MSDDRSCGTCYACCVWLGIDSPSLRKWSGQACRHLDGSYPEKRCSIYEKRPAACSRYLCAWRSGAFADDMRPDQSGLLVTFYPLDDDPDALAATIMVTDGTKCGDFKQGPLCDILEFILAGMNAKEVRVVVGKTVFYFRDGMIRLGKLLKTNEPEALKFEIDDRPPFGRYGFPPSP